MTPRLQRDRRVQARVGRHQHVRLALDLVLQDVEVAGSDGVRVVGDPDRAVFERVDGVLGPQLVRVDDAGTRGPDRVVRSAERRRLVVGHALRRLHVLTGRVVDLGDAVDLVRRVGIGRRRCELRDFALIEILGHQVRGQSTDERDDHHHCADGHPRDLPSDAPRLHHGDLPGLLLAGLTCGGRFLGNLVALFIGVGHGSLSVQKLG